MQQNSHQAGVAVSLDVMGHKISFSQSDAHSDTPFVLPVERAYAIHFGGQPYAVMMLTPSDIHDFAIGFALTEGVIKSAADIRAIDIRDDENSSLIDIMLHPDRFKHHLARQRSLSGRTSCGMCGITHIDDITRASHNASADHIMPSKDALHNAITHINAHQKLNAQTHAVHAAAWCDETGTLRHIREDVGRHNALDKLIGVLADTHTDCARGFVLITSRCSFEMVEKTAIMGIGTLVAISAPTSLALQRASELGMNVIAIARADSAVIFHHHKEGALI
jgi:FdhD protein